MYSDGVTTGETTRHVERKYAHFHRVLGGLLQELAAQTGCVHWLGDTQEHLISGDHEHNRYARALYRVPSLEPYTPQLDELARVQDEALTELGLKQVPAALLLPSVIVGVSHVRIHETVNYRTTPASKVNVLAKINSAITTTKQNLSLFEQQGGVDNPGTKRIVRELQGYETARAAVAASTETDYRVRLEQRRIRPYIYLADQSAIQAESRKHGLILVGRNIQVSNAHSVRKQRSDKRYAQPIFTYGKTSIYLEREWQGAR